MVLHLSVIHKELYIVCFDYNTPLYILSIAEKEIFLKISFQYCIGDMFKMYKELYSVNIYRYAVYLDFFVGAYQYIFNAVNYAGFNEVTALGVDFD